MSASRSSLRRTPFATTALPDSASNAVLGAPAARSGAAWRLNSATARRISYQRSTPLTAPSLMSKSILPDERLEDRGVGVARGGERGIGIALAHDAVGLEARLHERADVDALGVLVHGEHRAGAGFASSTMSPL